ncbi:MAG: nitroreductase family protein [Nocardioidaceae bacterium]|nr:nitroreductase family protein [Nocardioidaceae bacterium]
MELSDVVRRRRMVRRYTDEPVAPAVVQRALEHAVRAPSAGFSQGWGFLVLDDAPDVVRFWTAATPTGGGRDAWSDGMRRAPVVVVALSCKAAYLDRYAEPDKGWTEPDAARWPAPYWDIDAGMAALLVLLTVTDAGLGACFFGVPSERIAAVKDEFGVPDDHHPIGAITIGHPATETVTGSARSRPRRALDDVVHHGQW